MFIGLSAMREEDVNATTATIVDTANAAADAAPSQQQCPARAVHTHDMRLQLLSQLLKAGLQQCSKTSSPM